MIPLDPRARRDEAVAALKRAFAAAGLDSPGADARLIAAHALGVAPLDLTLRGDEPLGAEAAGRLEALARRRLAREPVDRILGQREFWGLPFRLSPDTLSPRPDTEALVAAALRHAPRARRILDLGTGSGCILTALLHERPGAWGLGTDRSPGALAAARENARSNGVGARAAFAAGSWGAALAGPFDLVVSNPPYIASGVVPTLDEEVRRHDPAAALDGGEDGLDAYRAILADAPRLLDEGGILALEIGFDQEEALRALAAGEGFVVAEVARDLAGHPRVVVLRAASSGRGGRPGP